MTHRRDDIATLERHKTSIDVRLRVVGERRLRKYRGQGQYSDANSDVLFSHSQIPVSVGCVIRQRRDCDFITVYRSRRAAA
jgi:hypothetical protein